jgi:hypothetical protein
MIEGEALIAMGETAARYPEPLEVLCGNRVNATAIDLRNSEIVLPEEPTVSAPVLNMQFSVRSTDASWLLRNIPIKDD